MSGKCPYPYRGVFNYDEWRHLSPRDRMGWSSTGDPFHDPYSDQPMTSVLSQCVKLTSPPASPSTMVLSPTAQRHTHIKKRHGGRGGKGRLMFVEALINGVEPHEGVLLP